MFDNVNLDYFKKVSENPECKEAYCRAFVNMVNEYDDNEKNIINNERQLKHKRKITGSQIKHSTMQTRTEELLPRFTKFMSKPILQGVDSTTWSESKSGKKPAPPWLFAMLCYLTGHDLKNTLDAIVWQSQPDNMNVEIDILVTLQNAGYIKNLRPDPNLSTLKYDFSDYKYFLALKQIVGI